MPKVRKLTGNFRQMLEIIYPNRPEIISAFIGDDPDIAQLLLKDLKRQPFFSTNGMSYDHHLTTWMALDVPKSYSQGNMTASFYYVVFQAFLEKFMSFNMTNSEFASAKQHKKVPELITEENRDGSPYSHEENQGRLTFAYYDDYGVPCGVTIIYSKLDPSLWTAAIIRNTVAKPKDQEVMLITPENFLNLKKEGLTTGISASRSFWKFLRSESFKTMFNDEDFLENGLVNIEKLNVIEATNPFVVPPEIVDRIAKLKRQDEIIKPLKLNPKQFDIVVTAIKEKQLKQLENIEKWNESWRAERLRHAKSPTHLERVRLAEERLKQTHVPTLDEAIKQSFLRRHAPSVVVAVLSFVVLIGMALILSGVFAPLGFALTGVALITGFVAATLAAITLVSSGIKIGFNQKELTNYQVELADAMTDSLSYTLPYTSESLDQTYQRKVDEVGAHIEITNDPEQLKRAVLAADFSDEEFAALQERINAVKEEPALVDEIGGEFKAAEDALDQVIDPDNTLVAQAARAVDHVTPTQVDSPRQNKPQPSNDELTPVDDSSIRPAQ